MNNGHLVLSGCEEAVAVVVLRLRDHCASIEKLFASEKVGGHSKIVMNMNV